MTALVRRCDGCRYSRPAAKTDGALLICHRYPPMAGITLVDRDSWCGEWRQTDTPPVAITLEAP